MIKSLIIFIFLTNSLIGICQEKLIIENFFKTKDIITKVKYFENDSFDNLINQSNKVDVKEKKLLIYPVNKNIYIGILSNFFKDDKLYESWNKDKYLVCFFLKENRFVFFLNIMNNAVYEFDSITKKDFFFPGRIEAYVFDLKKNFINSFACFPQNLNLMPEINLVSKLNDKFYETTKNSKCNLTVNEFYSDSLGQIINNTQCLLKEIELNRNTKWTKINDPRKNFFIKKFSPKTLGKTK